ncbi:MAG: hypothetical protein R3C19_11440 [Planctomycetaceae bacterium]
MASAEQLRDLADQALLLQAPESAFEKIELYPTLTGDNALGRQLKTVMWNVERELRQQRDAGAQPNDVVMFYYRGREHRRTTGDDGDFVLEDFANRAVVRDPARRDAAFRDTQSITGTYLSALFKRLPGAHVVFLDMEDPQPTIPVAGRYGHDWPHFPNLGLFRVAWTGPQPGITNPPGPLLTAVRKATAEPDSDGVVVLGTIAKVVESYFAGSRSTSVETVVPPDLATLTLARLGRGQSPDR